MNLLLICEIVQDLPLPVFGGEFAAHIASKRNTAVRAASLTAWNLLACALKQTGIEQLPDVHFGENGKPCFDTCPLHFSLAHSKNMAAALVSDAPCAVDIEAVRSQVRDKLYERCLSETEIRSGCDFFDVWTQKECMGKLSGKGLPARPAEMNSLDPEYARCFFPQRLWDSAGHEYALAALCTNGIKPETKKIMPEELI